MIFVRKFSFKLIRVRQIELPQSFPLDGSGGEIEKKE